MALSALKPISSGLRFSGELWVYSTEKTAWHFVSLPRELAHQINFFHPRQPHQPGFGSIRVGVTIGGSEWQTSIFPDKKSQSYFLPIKAEVRARERLTVGDKVEVVLAIL